MEAFNRSWLIVSSSDGPPSEMTILAATPLVPLSGDVVPHDLITLASRPATEEHPMPITWEA